MVAEIPHAPGKAALPVERRGLLTIGVMIATILQVLDATIANVAIPHMQASLGATIDEISWVLTSYIIAAAIVMPIIGWAAERIGSRQLFLVCTTGFIITSMLCGISSNIEEMVFFRVLQGIFGAALAPLSQTVMMDINPPERQVKALSIWSAGVMVGPVMGPMLGGWLTENYDWRWVFFVNVPLGIVCLVILWALLPSRPRRPRPFDLKGFFLLAMALGMLQLFLDRGSSEDWLNSWEIRIEILMFISFGWLFLHHQLITRHPVIERATLADRNFTLGLFMTLMVGAVMMSVMALLPSMLQAIYGHNVFTTGLLLAPRGIGMMVAMYFSGYFIHRVDVRMVVAFGYALIAYSMWSMTGWSMDMGWQPMVVTGIIQGVGMGFVFVPLNAISFSTLPPALRTEGAGVSGLARNIGGSIGISIVTALLARNIQVAHQDMVSHITSANVPGFAPNIAQALGAQGVAILHMVDAEVNRQALMIAYLDDFLMITYWALVPIPFLLLFRKSSRQQIGSRPPAIEH